MKKNKIKNKFKKINKTILRYSLTVVFLVAATVFGIINIAKTNDHASILMISCIVGAALAIVGQAVYEKFFQAEKTRWIIRTLVVITTLIYYFIISGGDEIRFDQLTQSLILVFVLIIGFLLVPSLKKGPVNFNESFMMGFKAFFISLFFALTLFLGSLLIIGAIDTLIVSVDYRIMGYISIIDFVLFMPIYLLSLIPQIPKHLEKKEHLDESIETSKSLPRIVEILFNNIIIPLITVFTLVLILYIVTSLSSDFWKDNLLEPMLISYAVIIIVTYIITCGSDHMISKLFKAIAPKILILVALLQTLASLIKLTGIPVTYGRYYVIAFGIFAIISGVILSTVTIKHTGLVAIVFIGISLVTISPIVGAFPVSNRSHENHLEKVLVENQMLVYGKIKHSNKLSPANKIKIRGIMEYLNQVEYIEKSDMLKDYNFTGDFTGEFNRVFGFQPYDEYNSDVNEVKSIYLEIGENIDLEEYELMIPLVINYYGEVGNEEKLEKIQITNKDMYIEITMGMEEASISLRDRKNVEIINYDISEINSSFKDLNEDSISIDQASFIKENNKAKIKIIVKDLFTETATNSKSYNMTLYLLVEFK